MKTTLLCRLTFIFLLALGATAARGQSAFFNAVTSLNPVAYWPLQETVQPPIADVETNYGSMGADGDAYYSSTNVLKGTAGVTGDGDTCLKFNNQNGSFLAVPTTDGRVSLPVGPFSVEAWVNPTNTTTLNEVWTIAAQTGSTLNGNGNLAGWGLVQNYVPSLNSSNFWGWTFHVFNGVGLTGGAEAVAPYRYVANTWYHLVGVYDGTNAFLYVNGVLASETLDTGSYARDTWDPLTIGATWQNTKGYAGWIDEVAIYTNALTSSQIQNHYNNVGGSSYASIITNTDNAFMYWRMDSQGYTAPATSAYPVAANYGSASSVNALYLSGTTPGMPGPSLTGLGSPSYGCAISPVGTDATNTTTIFKQTGSGTIAAQNVALNSGILVTNLAASLNLSNQPETLICWFKGNPAYATFHNLVGIHGDVGARLAISSGVLQWYSGAGGNLAPTINNFNDGNWHFVAGVYTNGGTFATGTNFLYVDGNLVGSAVNTSAQTPTLTNQATLLGGAINYSTTGNGNSYADRFFDGSLAHVAFFTNALTASQIASLYTNATGGVLPSVPVITGQPISGRTNSPGTGINGSGTGSYIFEGVTFYGAATAQWYFNSASNYAGATLLASGNKYAAASATVAGTTSQQMTISNLVNSDSGYYYVVLTNNSGSATSILASFTVMNQPSITGQTPAGGTLQLYPNQNYTLSVTAGGTNQVYQWFTNNAADNTFGTSSTYSLTNVQPAMSGYTYQCVVTNAAGSATNLLVTLIVLPFPAALTNSTYASNLLALNPSDYWPMHETTPPAQGDIETNYGSLGALGNGYYEDWNMLNLGLVTHGLAGALAGNSDTCVALAGSNTACLVIPHVSPLTTISTPFTLEAWIRPFNDNSYSVILGQGVGVGLNGSANLAGFALQYSGTPDTFSLVSQDGVGSADYEQKTTVSYPPNQWYHLVCTFDGTNVAYYVNGNQASFGTLQSAWPGPMVPDSWSPLVIGGGRWGSGGATHPFFGLIDHVAIYTNLLSSGDISQHYSDGTTSVAAYETDVANDDPLLYYRMNSPTYVTPPQSTWPVLTNYGSVGVNGVYSPNTIPGGVMGPSASGILPTALSGTNAMPGNGVSSYADAGADAALNANFVNYQSYSVSIWFKGDPSDARAWNALMSGNDSTWRLAINQGTGQFYTVADGAGGTKFANDGNWHQAVVTCQGISTNLPTPSTIDYASNNIYLDGQLVATSVSHSNTPALETDGPLEVILGNESGYTTNGTLGRSFAGNVCEAAIWNGTVLASNQVVALYNSAAMPVFITQQPAGGTNIQGTSFTTTVFAGGQSPSYQWYRNGQPLPIGGQTNLTIGATNASLTINPVVASDGGTYFVVVSNSVNSVTSAPATLLVYSSPVITAATPLQYTNLMILYSGANPTFSVTATGASPIHYQWYSNNVAIPGYTTNTATMTNIQVGMLTNWCVLTNIAGSATSMVWIATVITPTAPYPLSVMALHPAGYWRLNEPDDGLGDGNPGAIAEDYINGDDGIYTNTLLGQPGYTSNSNPNTDPTETSAYFDYLQSHDCDANSIQGIDFATPAGSNAEFTVAAWVNGTTATGTGGIVSKGYYYGEEFDMDCGAASDGYRFEVRPAGPTNTAVYNANSTVLATDNTWHLLVGVCDEANSNISLYIDGRLAASAAAVPLSGVTNSTSVPIMIGSRPSAATSGGNEQFGGHVNDVAIFKYALSAAQIANIYSAAGAPPFFTQLPPTNIDLNAGATLTLPAVAGGTGPLTNTWYDVNGGTNVLVGTTNTAGPMNAGLVVSNVPASWNGDTLQLTVANLYGSTNLSVSLTVNTNPVIFTQLPETYTNLMVLYAGSSPSFSISASGPPPLYYQWYSNNVAIAGATNTFVTFTNIHLGMLTNYCVVSDFVGVVTSEVWVASVIAPTAPYPQAVMALKPFGYWRLDEPDDGLSDGNPGAVAEDYANANNGLYTNTVLGEPGYTASSVLNSDPTETSALFGSFNPNNSDASSIQGVDFATGAGTNAEFSVAAWVSGVSIITGNAGIVTKGYFYGEELDLDCGGPNNSYRFEVRPAGPSTAVYNASSTFSPTNNGAWHLLVGVCDEANSNVVLYIDGQLAASVAIPPLSGCTNSTATPMMIGARASNPTSGGNNQYDGYVNDVAIFKYALTAAQVQNLYITAGEPPYFTQQPPTNVVASAGGTLTVAAADIGTALLTNQWWDATAGSPLSGQTNATLVISNVSNTLNGHLIYLTAANGYGSTNSANVTLTIATAPAIAVNPPSGIFVPEGQNVSISVTADGDAPLAYQWQVSGTNALSWVNLANGSGISGATTNVLTITDAQLGDSADYQLVVTNIYGAATSSVTLLIVGAQPVTFDANGLGWTAEQSGTFTSTEISSNVLTITDGANSETRGFFFNYPQSITAFQASFTYLATPGTSALMADGTCFVLQNDPRGPAAIGAGGGSIGVGVANAISPSLDVEMNLYNGSAGGSGFSVNTNGAFGPYELLGVPPANVILTNGDPINVTITYSQGQPLVVSFSDPVASTSFTTNINNLNLTNLLGGATAYVGFAGADGGDNSVQTISNFQFSNLPPSVSAQLSGGSIEVTYTGTLMSATNLAGPFNPVAGATSPYAVPATNSQLFFRAHQ